MTRTSLSVVPSLILSIPLKISVNRGKAQWDLRGYFLSQLPNLILVEKLNRLIKDAFE
jgi:hypothetical protein